MRGAAVEHPCHHAAAEIEGEDPLPYETAHPRQKNARRHHHGVAAERGGYAREAGEGGVRYGSRLGGARRRSAQAQREGVGREGFEPSAYGLKGRSSTIELAPQNLVIIGIFAIFG